MLNNTEIKNKTWEQINKYINESDDIFNSSATSFKISESYNLVVWCDIAHEENNEKYFLVSIRYNPFDELFGDDIGLEWGTQSTEQDDLFEVVDKLLKELSELETV